MVLLAQRWRLAVEVLQAGAGVTRGELDVRRRRGGQAEAVAAPRRAEETLSAWVDGGNGGHGVPPLEGAAADAAPAPAR
jgi:hypothetical protein